MSSLTQTTPMTLDQVLDLAKEYLQTKRLAEARDLYEQILAQRPGNTQAYCGLADVFVLQGLLQEGIALYEYVLTLEPDSPHLLHNLAVAEHKAMQPESAMIHAKRCLELVPTFAKAHCTVGTLYSLQGEIDLALEHLQKAVELEQYNYPEALDNLGVALMKAGRVKDGLDCFQRVVDLDPSYPAGHANLGMMLLLTGDFERGWPEYEWRLKGPDRKGTRFPAFNQWDGSDLKGKTILLYREQGLGDTIQFIRYVPMVVERGGKVIVECQAPLRPIVEGYPGVERLLIRKDDLPEFNVHCALMSLPYVFQTRLDTIPNKVPYLYADPRKEAEWRMRMARERRFKVGLVWAGRPQHKGDKARSLRLEQFAPLAASGATFFSLQKGDAAEQGNTPPEGMRFVHCSPVLNDFTDTAALVANMDLVITVDTSVAHLVGAMGKPVWTLLPLSPDWRWMLKRSDTTWYPTMRLLRQTERGDWKSVIERAAAELSSFTKRMTRI